MINDKMFHLIDCIFIDAVTPFCILLREMCVYKYDVHHTIMTPSLEQYGKARVM